MSPNAKYNNSLYAALDIGTSKIACFIGRLNPQTEMFDVLGVGHHRSDGVKNGVIVDLDKAESAIRQTVHAAENMAADILKGYPLREVVVNVSDLSVQSFGHTADIRVAGYEITKNDIKHALVRSQQTFSTEEYEIIHTIPFDFKIDGHAGIKNPEGMFGQNMHVDIHLIGAESNVLRNITTCIERSHLDITAFGSSAYMSGLSCLVDDERNLGCTVIDIGAGTTSIAVFQKGKVIYIDALPIGGQHITSDISKGLTTSIANAERLKVLYGSALASQMDENEMIEVPPLGEENLHDPNHIPRSLLIGIIQPRMEEIFEMVRARLKDSGLRKSLGQRVVLTGGTSQMPGIRDLGQYAMDKQVRLGKPIRLSGLPDSVSGPSFSATAGLLTYIAQHSQEIPAQIAAEVEPESIWERTKLWIRENW